MENQNVDKTKNNQLEEFKNFLKDLYRLNFYKMSEDATIYQPTLNKNGTVDIEKTMELHKDGFNPVDYFLDNGYNALSNEIHSNGLSDITKPKNLKLTEYVENVLNKMGIDFNVNQAIPRYDLNKKEKIQPIPNNTISFESYTFKNEAHQYIRVNINNQIFTINATVDKEELKDVYPDDLKIDYKDIKRQGACVNTSEILMLEILDILTKNRLIMKQNELTIQQKKELKNFLQDKFNAYSSMTQVEMFNRGNELYNKYITPLIINPNHKFSNILNEQKQKLTQNIKSLNETIKEYENKLDINKKLNDTLSPLQSLQSILSKNSDRVTIREEISKFIKTEQFNNINENLKTEILELKQHIENVLVRPPLWKRVVKRIIRCGGSQRSYNIRYNQLLDTVNSALNTNIEYLESNIIKDTSIETREIEIATDNFDRHTQQIKKIEDQINKNEKAQELEKPNLSKSGFELIEINQRKTKNIRQKWFEKLIEKENELHTLEIEKLTQKGIELSETESKKLESLKKDIDLINSNILGIDGLNAEYKKTNYYIQFLKNNRAQWLQKNIDDYKLDKTNAEWYVDDDLRRLENYKNKLLSLSKNYIKLSSSEGQEPTHIEKKINQLTKLQKSKTRSLDDSEIEKSTMKRIYNNNNSGIGNTQHMTDVTDTFNKFNLEMPKLKPDKTLQTIEKNTEVTVTNV